MPWGYAAIAVGAIGGSVIASDASEDASKAQTESASEGMAAEERMFERSLELQEPYREAGYESLGGLQELTTPEGRASGLRDFYASQEYGAMQGQAEQSMARKYNAMGGLRGGSSYQALESIAPQLGQDHLAGRYDRLTGLANMGMGAASQGASGATQLGGSINAGLREVGEAQAYGKLGQAKAYSEGFGTLAGLAGDYFGDKKV
jgi:hypothetical protein